MHFKAVGRRGARAQRAQQQGGRGRGWGGLHPRQRPGARGRGAGGVARGGQRGGGSRRTFAGPRRRARRPPRASARSSIASRPPHLLLLTLSETLGRVTHNVQSTGCRPSRTFPEQGLASAGLGTSSLPRLRASRCEEASQRAPPRGPSAQPGSQLRRPADGRGMCGTVRPAHHVRGGEVSGCIDRTSHCEANWQLTATRRDGLLGPLRAPASQKERRKVPGGLRRLGATKRAPVAGRTAEQSGPRLESAPPSRSVLPARGGPVDKPRGLYDARSPPWSPRSTGEKGAEMISVRS